MPLSELATVVLVPDLAYALDAGSFTASADAASYFFFDVGGAGEITAVIDPFTGGASAAATGGASLTLANVRVTVDPTSYAGTYSLGGYTSLSGPVTRAIVPALLTAVAAGGEVGYVVASATGVTPASLTLAGATFTFEALDAVGSLLALIDDLAASGDIPNPATAGNIATGVDNAADQIGTNDTAARNMLDALLNRLDAFLNAGRITAFAHAALVAAITALRDSLP